MEVLSINLTKGFVIGGYEGAELVNREPDVPTGLNQSVCVNLTCV